MSDFQLFSYYRSSCSYRVRIALNHKSLNYNYLPVHLVKDGGEQNSETYKKHNPRGFVPSLVHGEQTVGESMAIFHYLDQTHPMPPLFPKEAYKMSLAIQMCELINSGIQPLQNLSVLKKLKSLGLQQNTIDDWIHHFMHKGFQALESLVSEHGGTFCLGGEVTAVEMFLVPQMYNARRFNVDLSDYSNLVRITETCEKLEAFEKAHPGRQPDTPEDQKI